MKYSIFLVPMLINLTNMPSKETEKLFEFLQNQREERTFWAANTRYNFGESEISLSHDLVWRKRKGTKEGHRYEIITPDIIGQGAAGAVYRIAATLALDTRTIHFKQAKARVVKIQRHNANFTLDMLQTEYHSSERVQQLAVKEPTVIPDSSTSYTVMKKIKGRDLFDIIEEDSPSHTFLSLKQRLDLTKALLHALKQVSDANIVHRDIKPENILVDLTEPITVTIIDFGFSIPADKSDNKNCGTPNYAPPEAYTTEPVWSPKSDVFSMARILGMIWRDDLTYYTYGDIPSAQSYASRVKYDSLFRGISLEAAHQNIIRTTLADMSKAEMESRLSIDDAIKAFEKVRLPHEYSKKSPVKNNDVQQQIQVILFHVAQLRLKAVDLRNRGYSELSDTLYQLTNALEFKTYNFKIQSEEARRNTIDDYSSSCKQLIENIKPQLGIHRNTNYILANISLAIAGLGIFYLIAISANKLITNNYLFFSTPKTLEIAENIEKSLDTFQQEVASCA
jgi:serine/threonine-protein kinase LegK1